MSLNHEIPCRIFCTHVHLLRLEPCPIPLLQLIYYGLGIFMRLRFPSQITCQILDHGLTAWW